MKFIIFLENIFVPNLEYTVLLYKQVIVRLTPLNLIHTGMSCDRKSFFLVFCYVLRGIGNSIFNCLSL
jgi:hypothetical protein